MGARGPKKQPSLLQKLHGNPSNRKVQKHDPEGLGSLWAPPKSFNSEQREQWHYAIEHAPRGLLTGTDKEVLEIWCCAVVEYRRAVAEVQRSGQVLTTEKGNLITNPFMSVMNKQALLILKCGGEMGFSPSARASLGSRAPEFNQLPAATGEQINGDLPGYLEDKPDDLAAD